MKLRLILLILALFALFSTVTGGYLYYNSAKESAFIEAQGELVSKTESLKERLQRLVSYSQEEARLLARFEELQDALVDRNQETVLRANRILDHFAGRGPVDVCFLMDDSGITVASSNRKQKDTFGGRDYSFRTYFREAMRGQPAVFMAVGVTSGISGIYFSHPVYSAGRDNPTGVAVIKTSVNDLQKEIELTSDGITMLVHSSGMIFFSSKESWALNLLWRVPPEELSRIAETKQFGPGPWKWTGLEKQSDNHAFDESGEEYLVNELNLDSFPGWRIVHLCSLNALSRRMVYPSLGTTGYIALFVCVFLGGAVVVLYGMAQHDIRSRNRAEEALRQSEEKYRLMFDHSPLGVFHFDATGTITACNDNFVRILGSSRERLVGLNTIKDLRDAKMIASIKEALSGGMGHYEDDYTAVTSGKTTPVKCEFGPIVDQDGKVAGGIGIVENITDRKRTEDALRESEERFKSLFDNSADLIYTHDLNGDYKSVNRAVEALLGYTPEEFLKLNFRQIVDPDYLALTEQKFRMKVNGRVDRTGPYEVLVLTKSGQPIWLEVNSRIIFQQGERVGVHGTARDVTDRKRAQEELKRLFAAVEQAGETIVVTDPSGCMQYVNPSFEITTGYTRQEAIGKNPRILQSGQHHKSFYEAMWKTLKAGEVWRGRFTNRKKDGTLFEETATISPIKDEKGKIVNYVAVKRDVTSEVVLQKQLLHAQKMEAIGTLAGGMAHDFNNLLMAILGYSELLLQRKVRDDPEREKLVLIRQAAKDGADLVKAILTFSKRVESRTRPTDLNAEIRRNEKLLVRTLPKMIEVELVLSDDLRVIEADPVQIEQVLLNLAVNAGHAMPEGGRLLIETRNVTLREDYAETHLDVPPGKYVLLAVTDTGIGMATEVLDRVFEPFFTTKTDGEGTGLGLSMVHGIVAQHSGHIRCYSEPGVGTTFKIYFPVAAVELLSDVEMTREMPAFGTETILLVDDDGRVRELVRELITLAGYTVLTASNGADALEEYAKHREEISLVILDLIMPGMSGKRCLEELLRMDPDAKVLVSSGYSANGLTKKTLGTGERGFISKPYDGKDILRAIRTILDRGRL